MTARVLVVGLDGLEPSLVQRWVASRDMPTIGRLRDEGRWGPLVTTLPCATFPAWTSFMTGVWPGEHGVFDFARLVKGTYDVSFDGALSRRRPTLQGLSAAAGMRVASVGFPGTWPPEPLPDGIMISGFDSPVAVGIDDSFVHPPELAAEIRERFGRYVFADFAETHTWLPGWHQRAAQKLMRGMARRRDIASHLLDKNDWDLFMVHFGESDTAAHHFWAFMDELSPRRPEGRVDPKLQGFLQSVYRRLDEAVAELVARARADVVMIASDHGFGGAGDKVFTINRWLAEQGLLKFVPRRGLAQRAVGLGVRAATGLVPGRLQERLWRSARPLAGRAEARRRFSGIDWAGTQAFSGELSYNPTIRLNVRDREPEGIVAPEDVPGLTARIIDALEALRDPWDGSRVVKKAWSRDVLYAGQATEDAPEIVLDLELDGGYTYNCLSSGGRGDGPVWRWLTPGERLGAKGAGMNGTHRREGFWLVHGSGVAPRRKRAQMVDMAPTILTALGLEAPDWIEGCSQLRANAPVKPLPSLDTSPEGGLIAQGYTPAQQAIVEERLRKLGYI